MPDLDIGVLSAVLSLPHSRLDALVAGLGSFALDGMVVTTALPVVRVSLQKVGALHDRVFIAAGRRRC